MDADSLEITTVKGSDHRVAALTAYHRRLPEVRVEADTPESALDRLAERLALELDGVSDHYHRGLIRSALGDVDRARSGH